MQPPIALVGLMGAGKSEVGAALARRLGGSLVDLDEMIAAGAGRSIAEIFAAEGEAGFRARESRHLEQSVAAGAPVLALGGGVVLDQANRDTLRSRCRVVWLQVSPAEAARRIGPGTSERPLLVEGLWPPVEAGSERDAMEARLERLLEKRRDLYAQVADLVVVTDGRTAEQVAELVLSGLSEGAESGAGRSGNPR